jgi:hypothetical protein
MDRRIRLTIAIGAILAVAGQSTGRAQPPSPANARTQIPNVAPLPAPAPPPAPPPAPATLAAGGVVVNLPPAEIDALRKQVEIQQKQIDTLQKMTKLLADKIKAAPTESSPVLDKLQEKTAELDSRSLAAAHRDQEAANAIDKLNDQVDAQRVNDRFSNPQLRQLFLPMQPYETPLSIYGQIFGDYTKFNKVNGLFSSPDFATYWLVQLRQRLLLEASLDFNAGGVGADVISMDYFINKNMTLVAGRFLTPIGFFNERLNHEWINKLPDSPLMFRQVSPLTATDGLMLRGGAYLGGSPVKMEYMVYLGNGFNVGANPAAGLNGVADLGTLTGGPDEFNGRAYGGRIGLWYPALGLTGGLSGYTNGVYAPNSRAGFSLFQIDTGFRRGNWDFRAEYAQSYQDANFYIGQNIRRWGMYAQLAYRDYNSQVRWIYNTELVFRYSFANFSGIDSKALDLTAYGDPRDVPVNRNQYTFGLNYYFYPSMFIKFAYQINQEMRINLHDNVFMAQAIWAF